MIIRCFQQINVKISHNTHIFFVNSQFMKGLHKAFLEDIHVIKAVSIDNSNNDIFFVEAKFNPNGVTTIKRSRQVLYVFSVYCVLIYAPTLPAFVVASQWKKVYPCI